MAESLTLHASIDSGFTFKSLEGVREPIDFRLSKASRPSGERLDVNLSRQIRDLIHEGGHYLETDKEKQSPVESEPLYVGSPKPDIGYQLIRCSGRIQGRR
jgi:hypothetical protein